MFAALGLRSLCDKNPEEQQRSLALVSLVRIIYFDAEVTVVLLKKLRLGFICGATRFSGHFCFYLH